VDELVEEPPADVPRPSQQFHLDQLGACSSSLTLVLEQCPLPATLPAGLCAIVMRQAGDPLSTLNFDLLQSSSISSLAMEPLQVRVRPDGDERTRCSGMRADLLSLLPASLLHLELSEEYVIDAVTPWPSSLRELIIRNPSWKSSPVGFTQGCSLSQSLLTKLVIHGESFPNKFNLQGLPETLEHLELLSERKSFNLVGLFPPHLKFLAIDVSEKFENDPATDEDVGGFLAGSPRLAALLGAAPPQMLRELVSRLRDFSNFRSEYSSFHLDLAILPATLERLVLVLKMDSEVEMESQLPHLSNQSFPLPCLSSVQVKVTDANDFTAYELQRVLDNVRSGFKSNVRVTLG
jgi:hypothetical protein